MFTARLLNYIDDEGIKAVSPDEFSQRITKVWLYLKQYVGALIIPASLLGMSISVLIFIGSSFVKSENGKKYSLAGFLSSISAIILYYALPLLAGIATNVGNIINGG